MILEPLVQGAGGMRMCRPHFLSGRAGAFAPMRRVGHLRRGADWIWAHRGALRLWESRDPTGYHLLGQGADWRLFCRWQLLFAASGFSRPSITMIPAKAFYHGHSYTANPLGCAAALASLDLLAGEPFRRLATWQREEAVRLCGHPRLKRVRVCGTIVAADVIVEGEEGYSARGGAAAQGAIFGAGIPAAAPGQ